ncbi:uncharacterized protein LOC119688092 isoform X3 [Teleopsis dalmanni]|nr:uncharacterized protein LOC119688092 isoform X3 [Teleopsis dalmanni]XP_037958661.1 uncharacterized protein LOC119688092 isoform X3 [Teleopsis dalmanni]
MTKRDLQHYYRYYSMTKNRSQFKKIIVIILSICFFSYIFVDYNLKSKIIHLKNQFDFVPRETYLLKNGNESAMPVYFVDTPGCRMPFFNVTDDNILQFMFRPQAIVCNKLLLRSSETKPLLYLNMNSAELLQDFNISDLRTVNCNYSEIMRKSDYQIEYLKPIRFHLSAERPVKIKAGVENILVQCANKESQVFYKDYHFFITKPRKHKIVNYSNGNISTIHKPDTFKPQKERINVLIFGIDSVSHLNFLRQMHNTVGFIKEKLSYVEFWGYNKVGDNTYPNLIPLLVGLDENELNISCLSQSISANKQNYDKCAFIWKRYKEANYTTAYGEDVSFMALFNYFRSGFVKQPTDYYLHTVIREMENHISYNNFLNVNLCLGGRISAHVLMEFVRKLLPLYKIEDVFAFLWSSTITHDAFNMPAAMDYDLMQLFQTFEENDLFNNTIVILMSDHGLRWGSFRKTYQGSMEERQPLFMPIFPKWFKSRYPRAYKNLETNANRLTTPFDVHEMLNDLVNLQNLEDANIKSREIELADSTEGLPRGISPFLTIPGKRTCENAGIAAHWCTCHQRQELQTTDARVQRAARYIVKLINHRIKDHILCRTLYLNSILTAEIAKPHINIIKDVNNEYSVDVTLRIQTKPGLAIYEFTVRMTNYTIDLTGTISRLNIYSSQSYCIDEKPLKMFCYCHR